MDVGSRRFLVYIAASEAPTKALEAMCGKTRLFDIAVRYHSEPNPDDPLLTLAEYVLTGGLSKFHSANQFLTALDLSKTYHGFLFLDGDVEFQPGDIDRLFLYASLMKFDLAQAALTDDSYSSWHVTRASPKFVCRQTSFVEIMAPYLSSDALALVLPTFVQSISGYGLDLAWAGILKKHRIGIIDEIKMRHTKPIDRFNGAFYRYLSSIGVNPDFELVVMCKRYGISPHDRPHDQAGYLLRDHDARNELFRVPLKRFPESIEHYMRWQDTPACLLARCLNRSKSVKLPQKLP